MAILKMEFDTVTRSLVVDRDVQRLFALHRADIIEAIRGDTELPPGPPSWDKAVDEIYRVISDAVDEAVGGWSIKNAVRDGLKEGGFK